MGLRTRLGLKTRRYLKRPFGRGQETQRAKEVYEVAKKYFEKELEEGDHSREERHFALSHDMWPDKRDLYEFSNHSPDEYLTDVERIITSGLNGKYAVLLRNKLITYQILSSCVATPKIHAVYMDGLNMDFGSAVQAGDADLFAKPITMTQGIGATRFKSEQYQETVERLLKIYSDLLITECIQQHEFMDALSPTSVNTVRILTVRDGETVQPRAIRGVVRVGTEASKPADNFSRGGIAFDLNIETGRIGLGAPKDAPTERIDAHPDSGVHISGRDLPGGNKIARKCVEMHKLLPFVPYIGWDIAIGLDDLILVEANPGPDVDVFQAHGPMLIDSRLREFYRAHDVL